VDIKNENVKVSLTEADLKDSFSRLLGSEAWLLLSRVSDFLVEQDIKPYLVGGFVRDALLGRDTADIDIAIASDAMEVACKLADALGGKYVPLDEVNRVGRVVLVDRKAPSTRILWELDLSTFKGNIEQDLARRDFTVDAMAIDLSQLKGDLAGVQLVDPFDGWGDLRRGVLRAVTETAFISDAARLLRAVRLAAELGFTIEKKTEALIQQHSNLIANVAGERVREELLHLLTVPGAGKYLTCLDELGLLTALFPEMAESRGVGQPREHFWDVLEHSLKTVNAVCFLLRQGDWEYDSEEILAAVPWSTVLAQHFDQEVSSGSTRRSLLKLAALLHDVSKPQTKALDGERIRFLGHAREGATVVADRLEQLRFSTKEVKLVETEVRHHLRPVQMSQEGLPTRRAIYRYFRDTGEAGIDILFLSLADHLATRGPNLNLGDWREHTKLVDYVLGQHFEQERITRPSRLVDGHDLIDIYSMSPGPELGEVLEVVREAQASGEVTNREEALSLIGRVLASTHR